MSTVPRPKVGLLALTLELYEKLAPDLRQGRENWVRREILPALGARAEVLFEHAVFRRDEIEAALAGFKREEADAVVVLLLTYSPSQLSLPALQHCGLPLIIWNTQELLAIGQSFSPADVRDNHGADGTQDLANVLGRAGVRYFYFTSHLRAPNALDELNDFLAAAAAVRRLRSARIGLISDDDERTPTLPFVAASRLMAEGNGFGGEGDIISATATRFLNWLNPPATFSEMFTVDFDGNTVFMSHMGEANVGMARRDRKVPLVARPTPITRTRDRQLALVTSLEPGPATFAALAVGPAGKWRIIASAVEIMDFGPLPGFCVPHFKLKPAGDIRTFLTDYAKAGGPHHNAVCFGDARRRLRLGAELLGAEYCEI